MSELNQRLERKRYLGARFAGIEFKKGRGMRPNSLHAHISKRAENAVVRKYEDDFGCAYSIAGDDVAAFGYDSDFGLSFGMPKFLRRTVRSAGRSLKKTARGIRKTYHRTQKSIKKGLGKVPYVGAGLAGVYTLATSPISLTVDASTGVRIDKAVMRNLKRDVRGVKDVASYARMVISLVPGVGSAAGAAISAGLALAEGQPITKALLEGVKGAIPGGQLAQSAFSVAVAAAEGKRIDKIAIQALPLSSDQKKAISAGLNVVVDVAQGKKVSKTLLNNALSAVPGDYLKALDVGIAMGTASRIQKAATKAVNPKVLKGLSKVGLQHIKGSAVLSASKKVLTRDQRKAFAIGTGMMRYQVKPGQVVSIRRNIPKKAQAGFDMALAAHVGRVAALASGRTLRGWRNRKGAGKPSVLRQGRRTRTAGKPSVSAEALARMKFAYYTGQGLKGASPNIRKAVTKQLKTSKSMQAGLKVAAKDKLSNDDVKPTVWQRVLNWLEIRPKDKVIQLPVTAKTLPDGEKPTGKKPSRKRRAVGKTRRRLSQRLIRDLDRSHVKSRV